MNPAAPIYFPLQTIALEFLVTERLDGTTPSLPFVLPPNPDAILTEDARTVRITQPRLGLIDLTGGAEGASADRIIRSYLIMGPTPRFPGDEASIGLAFDGVASDQGTVEIPPNAIGIDSDNCILVPQTGQVRIVGLYATPGNPVLVRLLVWQPRTVEELAEMTQVCCCRAGVFDEEGEPFFTQALYLQADCTRTVTDVSPPTAARGVDLTAITITGSGFVDGDTLTLISQEDGSLLPVFTYAVTNSTTIIAAVDVNGSVALGDYDVIVAPPQALPQCRGVGEGLFSVT